jgi:predicted nucleotidyltransferase
MDKERTKIDNIIQNLKGYIKLLESNNFPIKTAYLFGSYAKGTFNDWSDIDILLVSDSFEGIRFFDKEKIRKITLSYNSDISPFPYNPKDFDSSNLFIKEIIRSGIKIV